jgi:hypothetical protein
LKDEIAKKNINIKVAKEKKTTKRMRIIFDGEKPKNDEI